MNQSKAKSEQRWISLCKMQSKAWSEQGQTGSLHRMQNEARSEQRQIGSLL